MIGFSLERGEYQCSGCVFSSNRKKSYLAHLKQFHQPDFELLVDTLIERTTTNTPIDQMMVEMMNNVTDEVLNEVSSEALDETLNEHMDHVMTEAIERISEVRPT